MITKRFRSKKTWRKRDSAPGDLSKRAKSTLADLFSLLTSSDSFFLNVEEALCAAPTEKSLDHSSSSFFSRIPTLHLDLELFLIVA